MDLVHTLDTEVIMDNFIINSDLSLKNTKLTLDGQDITKKTKVVGISFWASSPHKEDRDFSGFVDLSVTTVDDNDNVETKTYRKSDHMAKKLPMGKIMKDLESAKIEDFVRYIGADVDIQVSDLADKIVSFCDEKSIKCPDKDVLCSRTLQSLIDKAEDLGISLNDESDDELEPEDKNGKGDKDEDEDKDKKKKKKTDGSMNTNHSKNHSNMNK